jgi:hypothetical protein
MSVFTKVGTCTLTSKQVTIVGKNGFKSIGIKCDPDSAGDIYIMGDADLEFGSEPASAIALSAGEEIAIGGSLNSEIDGLTINGVSYEPEALAYFASMTTQWDTDTIYSARRYGYSEMSAGLNATEQLTNYNQINTLLTYILAK